MFDIGGWEFLLIAVLGIIIIGPKELPGAIRTVSMFVRRARELARDFQSGLEEVAREAELDKLTEEITGGNDPSSIGGSLRKQVEDTVDPEGDLRDAMRYDADWTDDDLLDMDPELDDVNKIHAGPPEADDVADGSVSPDTAAPPTGDADTAENVTDDRDLKEGRTT